MKPGMSENQAVGLVSKVLYDLGSEYVEAVNRNFRRALQSASARFLGPRAASRRPLCITTFSTPIWIPHLLLPLLHIGYASHAMNDAYKRCREYLDRGD